MSDEERIREEARALYTELTRLTPEDDPDDYEIQGARIERALRRRDRRAEARGARQVLYGPQDAELLERAAAIQRDAEEGL